MQNLVSYIKENKNIDFNKKAFNELDAAIFARLSYINFEKVVKNGRYFAKKPIGNIFKTLIKDSKIDLRFKFHEDRTLLEELASSKRFKNIYVYSYEEDKNIDLTKQFAAVTFLNKEKRNKFIVLSFRGTDGTYTGWKEDFEMCYKPVIPAQKEAEIYAKKVLRFSPIKKVYFVGHSKGGNLAIYASTFIKSSKIDTIYCYDSPGFKKLFLNARAYKNVMSKIKHFVPQTSIIGRLMNSDYESIIVDSNKTLLYQHNIYNWNVEKDEFRRLDKFTFISNKLKKILDQSLEKMNNEQKQEFVESLFNVIKEMTDNDIIQFGDSFLSFALRFRKAFKMQNDETKKLIYSIFTNPNDDEKEVKYIEPIHNKKSVLDKIKDKLNK